jgi:leucine efflux protein
MPEFGVVHVGTFIVSTIVLFFIPGPTVINLLQVAGRGGWREGRQAIAGILLANFAIVVMTVAGLIKVLEAHPLVLIIFKLLGGAYLFWMGLGFLYVAWTSLKKAKKLSNDESNVTAPELAAPVSGFGYFLQSFIIGVTNPKGLLFCLAFFIHFVTPSYPNPSTPLMILGFIYLLISLGSMTCIFFLGSTIISRVKNYLWLPIFIETLLGILFIVFSCTLVLSGLS